MIGSNFIILGAELLLIGIPPKIEQIYLQRTEFFSLDVCWSSDKELHSVVKGWLDPEYACGVRRRWSFHRPKDLSHFSCGSECTSASKHFSASENMTLGTFQIVLRCGRITIFPKSLKSVIDVVKV